MREELNSIAHPGVYMQCNKTVEIENKKARETKVCPITSIHAIYVYSGRPMIWVHDAYVDVK